MMKEYSTPQQLRIPQELRSLPRINIISSGSPLPQNAPVAGTAGTTPPPAVNTPAQRPELIQRRSSDSILKRSGNSTTSLKDLSFSRKNSGPSDISLDRKRLVDLFYNNRDVDKDNHKISEESIYETEDEDNSSSYSGNADDEEHERLQLIDNTNQTIEQQILQLKERIQSSIRKQIDIKEVELNEDVEHFARLISEITEFKLKLVSIVNDLNDKNKSIELEYNEFKLNYDKIMKNLVNLEKYEEILTDSKQKLSTLKHKLSKFDKIIEIGESLNNLNFNKSIYFNYKKYLKFFIIFTIIFFILYKLII